MVVCEAESRSLVMTDPDSALETALTSRNSADPARLPPICPNPVFVIGSPRSGTTVLARSLAQHSELWTSGESDVLFLLFANGFAERSFDRAMEIPGQRWLRVENVSREEFLACLGMGINALITSRSGGRRWIDHTPRYTLIVETLAEVFPGASFIHILRDGRDVVHSMLNFPADAVPDPAVGRFLQENVPWLTSMRGACKEWCEHVEAAMAFCDGHADRAMVVRYEDLVAAPEASFQSIYGFLGIADEGGPARFLASRRINSSFGGRPRLSGSELWEAWEEEQRRTFAEVAGATMLRCGYSKADELGRPADPGRPPGAFHHRQIRGLMKAPDYAQLVARVREAVESDVPPDSEVLVATRGDDSLLTFDGRRGWHFPRERDGTYAGQYPADSEAAIAHLEELRAQGATHLALPRCAFWWLDYYGGLQRHLDAAYPIVRRDVHVIVYDLTAGRQSPAGGPMTDDGERRHYAKRNATPWS
jgi:hypothetical protein